METCAVCGRVPRALFDYSMALDVPDGEPTVTVGMKYCGTKKCGRGADELAERVLMVGLRERTTILIEASSGRRRSRPVEASDRVISLL